MSTRTGTELILEIVADLEHARAAAAIAEVHRAKPVETEPARPDDTPSEEPQ